MAKIQSHSPGNKPGLGNTGVLAHGPSRPGGSQPATTRMGGTSADGGGEKGAGVSVRATPKNRHGK